MNEPRSAVVAGHICLDIIPRFEAAAAGTFESQFRPGQLVQIGPATFSSGGAVSNTGLALHKLGIPTQLIAKIGDDLFGQAIRRIVIHHGVQLAGLAIDPASSTAYSIIISPPGVDRLFLHSPGANNTFGADDIRYDLVAETDLFHFGYPPVMQRMFENNGAELVEIFRRAKAAGVITSLDMCASDPTSAGGRADWITILTATLPHVDIFLPSIDELLFMLRCATRAITPPLLSAVSQQLIAWGAKIVVIKLGVQGLYLRTGHHLESLPIDLAAWTDQEMWTPCFQVDVIGTTGAGDAAIAGFLSAVLRGLAPADAITAAVAVGACNVEAADALSGLRAWDETVQRIASGWPHRNLIIDDPHWQFDAERQIWST